MKKLMLTLATVALTSGSLINTNLWANKTVQNTQNVKTTAHSNFQTTNEDAEDIANKLWQQSIQLDPNFWFGKNIKNYQNQLNAQIVKQGILTADEVKYVSWKEFTVATAVFYWNKGDFTVSKDGAVCTGNVTLNASTGETTQQIATKLEKANIQFNYDYWNKKNVSSYLTVIRNILVNEKVLTKYEASNIIGFLNPTTITKTGKTPINFNVNDDNTQTYATANVNVVNDGLSAPAIANKLHTNGEYCDGGAWSQNDTYFLKSNTTGQYADSALVKQNLQNILKYDRGWTADLNTITLPHKILTNAGNGNNLNATVTKDGQITTTAVDLVAYNTPFLNLENQDTSNLSFDVNLTPKVISYLLSYFKNHGGSSTKNQDNRVQYFYQVIDDGGFDTSYVPYEYAHYYLSWDCLEEWMGHYGSWADCKSEIAECEGNCGYYDSWKISDLKFENELYHQILNAKPNACLSVQVKWHWEGTATEYGVNSYHFW